MAVCKATYGLDNVCGDILQASGVDKDFWFGYISDLGTKILLTQTAAISSLSFVAYAGLRKAEGRKFSHEFKHELVVAAGGSKSYKHTGVVKVLPMSTQDDVTVQQMTQAEDMFIVWQDNNESFFIHAPSKGLSAVAGPMKTSGIQAGEDVLTTLTFEGNEKVVPLRFSLGTTTQAIINYLDGLIR